MIQSGLSVNLKYLRFRLSLTNSRQIAILSIALKLKCKRNLSYSECTTYH